MRWNDLRSSQQAPLYNYVLVFQLEKLTIKTN